MAFSSFHELVRTAETELRLITGVLGKRQSLSILLSHYKLGHFATRSKSVACIQIDVLQIPPATSLESPSHCGAAELEP
jgi:hypothetical protein